MDNTHMQFAYGLCCLHTNSRIAEANEQWLDNKFQGPTEWFPTLDLTSNFIDVSKLIQSNL